MHFGPNMTPMVDVVMVILIFFMSAAGFVLSEHSLASALSGGESDAGQDDPLALPPAVWEVELIAGAEGGLFTGLGERDAPLDGLRVAAAGLVGRVGAGGVNIALRVGAGVAWDDVVGAHAALRDAGVERVSMGGAD